MVSIELSHLRDITSRNLQSNRIIWALVNRLGGEAVVFEDADSIAPFWQLEFSAKEIDGQHALSIKSTTKLPDQIQNNHEQTNS